MAQAAPNHLALPALDVEGLNRACGAAVDSEGDVYAASAGESKVYVFDPKHHAPGEQIAEISNAQEPCGLAVDSKGNLYVSQKANGQVVRYEPNAYPLTGTPSYGLPTVIDASGNAKGIAVDPFDDRLYVAWGDRVVSYDAEGTLGIDEVQVLRVGTASGGTFRLALPGEGGGGRNEVQGFDTQFTSGTYTLTFEGETTGPLAAHASALTVEEALESLPGIGDGDVSVSGFPDRSKWVEFTGALANTNVPLIVGDDQGTPIVGDGVTVLALSDISEPIAYEAPAVDVEAALEGLDGIGPGNVLVTVSGNRYVIAFAGALAHTDVPSLVADPSGLTLNGSGFSPEARLVNEAGATQGWSGQVGLGDLGEATGVAAYTYRGDSSRYVFVADASTDEIKTFAGSDIRALSLRRVDDGSATPAGSFGFGAAGTALAADAANGHLFVYDSLHSVVDEIEASGRFLDQIASASFADAAPSGIAVLPQRSEVQKLKLSSISGGTFTLGFGGEQTAALPSNATAAQIAAALTALGSIGSGNVEVEADETFRIRFVEALAARNVAEIAVDDSGLSGAGTAVLDTLFPGYGPGRLYVGAGAGAGARLLAFGPLAESSRALLDEPLSHVLPGARAVAVDSAGDVYVSDGAEVYVYGPEGNELSGFADSEHAKDLAVDSAGRVYVVDTGSDVDQQKVTYYTPSSYPPTPTTTYSRHEPPIATRDSFPVGSGTSLQGVAVDPADDHVFVAAHGALIELDSAAPGHESKMLNPSFGASLGIGSIADIAVDGPSGNVYISSEGSVIRVLDPTGKKVLARIDGYGSPRPMDHSPAIAVDQASGHVLSFDNKPAGVAQEYEPTGAFVVEFGEFDGSTLAPFGIAIDNSGGPSDGTAYVAFDGQRPGTPDVWAFAPLAYGEAPKATSGVASELSGGSARLNATVNPNGFELEDCEFEYLSEAQYDGNGKTFAGASSVPCAESLAQIGRGTKAVAVHADVSGLDPEAAYRFRLVATNEYGTSESDPSLFGPPLVTTGAAQPVFYGEATLRGEVDPSGLATSYRFQYGEAGGEYDHETAEVELPPGEEPVAVQAALTGLKEGTSYRFRLIAENEAKAVPGSERTFTTLVRRGEEACGNVEFRTGLSAKLPDCRAYELVSPAQTGGGSLGAPSPHSPEFGFNQWLTPPSGGSGMLSYEATTTLPGFEGTGSIDSYRAERAPGGHPPQGWRSEARSPTYAQVGGGRASSFGVASDQLYSLFELSPKLALAGTLPGGEYLRTPAGFEALGQGSLGTDPKAKSRFVSAGGGHVIFTAKAKLEPEAAADGVESIYDRAVGGPTGVASLPPGGFSAAEQEDFLASQTSDPGTTYLGASEDGSTIAFRVGASLYASVAGSGSEPIGERLAEPGERLQCANGPASVNQREVEWFRDGVAIPKTSGNGISQRFYAAKAGDAGAALQCRASSFEHTGGSGSVDFSYPPVRVEPLPAAAPPVPPAQIPAPSPGEPVAGTIESCDPGTWSGVSAPFAYRWYLDGVQVEGASAATYEVKAADLPAAIQCAVVGSNAGGAIVKASAITQTNPPESPPPPIAHATADLETAFAGISEDNRYLFYATDEDGATSGRLFRFDLETESPTEIAENAIFITVSPDGAQVFFSSATALTGAEENEAGQTAQAGQRNLYAWSGGETRFVAVLDPKDFLLGFGNEPNQNLGMWSVGLTAGAVYGRASIPARANPDGGVFVFQSHARLTEFENEGHGEIYRYAPAAPEGERLLCVSCDAGGAALGVDAMLEQIRIFFPGESIPPANANGRTLIPNLTPDGERVFFQSRERLTPDDVNEVSDVYEWSANGAGGCKRPGGCLALISSGQGEENSHLYSMSSDGRDVFFTTTEKLVGADVPGSPSIYDARVEGGIPDPPAAAPCQGDACQGAGSVPPALRRPGSSELGEGGNLSGREGGARRCPKGRRAVIRAGKRRCLKAKHRHRARHGKRRAR